MKRKLLKSFLWIAGLIVIFVILNAKVSTRQGVNYIVHTKRIPLYLKITDFFDRHYNYGVLTKSIIKGAKNDEERVMRIFTWTYGNMRRTTEGTPIIDDHVWYTIVRGYGVDDQFSDVFTVLCNYAGIDAFYSLIYAEDHGRRLVLSFVKIGGEWRVLDPYNGVYFKNNSASIATVDDIQKGKWVVVNVQGEPKNRSDYEEFIKKLPNEKEIDLNRANIQSPFKRAIFELKKLTRH